MQIPICSGANASTAFVRELSLNPTFSTTADAATALTGTPYGLAADVSFTDTVTSWWHQVTLTPTAGGTTLTQFLAPGTVTVRFTGVTRNTSYRVEVRTRDSATAAVLTANTATTEAALPPLTGSVLPAGTTAAYATGGVSAAAAVDGAPGTFATLSGAVDITFPQATTLSAVNAYLMSYTGGTCTLTVSGNTVTTGSFTVIGSKGGIGSYGNTTASVPVTTGAYTAIRVNGCANTLSRLYEVAIATP